MTSGFCRGLLTAISNERITKAGVRFSRIQVEWDKGGPEAAHDYTDFYGRGNCNRAFGISSFVHNRIRSTAKRVYHIYYCEVVGMVLMLAPTFTCILGVVHDCTTTATW